jgi:hypothetical protein
VEISREIWVHAVRPGFTLCPSEPARLNPSAARRAPTSLAARFSPSFLHDTNAPSPALPFQGIESARCVMGRLSVTRLPDGRLQLWVMYPTLFSASQVSLNPAAAWSALQPFNPSPGTGVEIVAGHSPDGRVQLFAKGNDNFVRTSWMKDTNPADGWMPWQEFTNRKDLARLALGQLADGRMQLFATGSDKPAAAPSDVGYLWTTWKQSTKINAPWTDWQLFNPSPTFAAGPLAVGSLSDGILQMWSPVARRGPGNSVSSSPGPLDSTWQNSTDPAAAWRAWQVFPPQWSSNSLDIALAAGQLSDGSTEVWAVTVDGMLHSSAKTSNSASAPWGPWQNPFTPNPGPVGDVAVGRLADGNAQIFVITMPASSGAAQILTARQTSPTAWTPWSTVGTVG